MNNGKAFVLLIVMSSYTLADAGMTISDFYRERTKCYCTSDTSGPSYKLSSIDIKKSHRGSFPVLDQSKTASLIYLSEKFSDSYKKSCPDSNTDSDIKCWVKNSYVKINGQKVAKVNSVLNEAKRICEDQGTMMGADSCD